MLAPAWLWRLGKRTVKEYMEDDAANLAAALAFAAFFSIFPLVLLLVAMASIFVKPEDAQAWVLQNVQLLQLQPSGTNFFLKTVTDVVSARGPGTGVAAVVGLIGLLVGASGVFGTLQTAINRAWDCKEDGNFIRNKLLDFLMVLGLALILFLSTIVSSILTALQEGSAQVIGTHPLLWQIINLVVTTVLVAGIVAVLFRTLPHCPVRWAEVWPGAVLTAVLWEVLKQGFAFYLGNFANYQAVYGALGGIIALQTWIYLSAQILLICAELSSEYGRERAERRADRNAGTAQPAAVRGSERNDSSTKEHEDSRRV
jgi:membrane protein